MDKVREFIKEVITEYINESILADRIEMSPAEFKDFIKAYQQYIDSNAAGNAVLTTARENWEDEGIAYVGYVRKNDVHFRYFPESLEFHYDPNIIEKPFVFVHKGGGTPSSGKVKED